MVGLPILRIQVSIFPDQHRAWSSEGFGIIHTIGGTLWNWALATSTANADTVDNIALLGLVTQAACLVRARWAGSAVDDVQLSELYYAVSANVQRLYSKSIKRCPQITSTIFQYVHRPDSKYWFGFDVVKRVDYLTSQQRTRRRNRRTSDCFFFCNSSRYLSAPILVRKIGRRRLKLKRCVDRVGKMKGEIWKM